MQCKQCGKEYRRSRWWQEFCSTKCRADFHNHIASEVRRELAARRPPVVIERYPPSEALKEMMEKRKAERAAHAIPPKFRKPVPKSEQWTRSERQELAQLAEEFLKAKQAEIA
jgi:hypothetical protein